MFEENNMNMNIHQTCGFQQNKRNINELFHPWRCHGEVFNLSFEIVFNISFVGLCLIFIFGLYACGVAAGFIFYFLIC